MAGENVTLSELGDEEKIKILQGFSQMRQDIEEELKVGYIEEDEAEKDLAAIDRIEKRLTSKKAETT